MPENLTALEASRLLGVNEKTIRTWIKNGYVHATKPTKQRLAIPYSEIDRIQRERAEREQLADLPTIRQLTDHIRTLERQAQEQSDYADEHWQQIEALLTLTSAQGEQLAQARQEIATQAEQIAALTEQIAQLRQPKRAARSVARPAGSTAPGPASGMIAARTFGEIHGLSRERIEGMINRGEIQTTLVPWQGGKQQHQLDPEQQAAAITTWQQLGIDFTRCEQCPHEP